jgi:putative methionine-R-sulfoxide reductase with GAF domain
MPIGNERTIDDRSRREARVAGLRDFRTPSLESIERRRMQLLIVNAVVLLTLVAGVFALATWPMESIEALRNPIPRFALLLVTAAFCAYIMGQERRLGRLTRTLADERVLTAALTNRLHEVTLLHEAGKALNAQLDLSSAIATILDSATELLDANGGSVMLVEGNELVAVEVRGREDALGVRIALGAGIAGHVALRREPILIHGQADPQEFPGLADREPYVESAMSVPLVHDDRALGVLNVNAALGRAFTEYDLRALSVFAEQAASAIVNARLFEGERDRVAELLVLRGGEEAAS